MRERDREQAKGYVRDRNPADKGRRVLDLP
jgi:hypothetical protein